MRQTIDGIEYERTVYSDRHETLVPVDGWPYNPRIFNLRKALIDDGKLQVCEKCNSKINIDAHHIEPAIYSKAKSGYWHQSNKSNHSASNGIFLCKKCHRKLHNTNKI